MHVPLQGLDYAFIGLPCGLDGSFVGSISLEAFSNFGLACKGTSIALRMSRNRPLRVSVNSSRNGASEVCWESICKLIRCFESAGF